MCVPVPVCALQFCQAKHKDVTMAVLQELYNYLSVQAGECQHIPTPAEPAGAASPTSCSLLSHSGGVYGTGSSF